MSKTLRQAASSSTGIETKIKTAVKSYIALVGNPNTGKSTLFNGLCRAKQKIANYPGTTMEKKIGSCLIENQQSQIIDLPGLYSLENKRS